jgi:hypothetical protein
MVCNEEMAMEDGRIETRQVSTCEYEGEQYWSLWKTWT